MENLGFAGRVGKMNTEIKPRAAQIEEYVASNELDSATRRLMDFADDFGTDRKQKRIATNLRALYTEIRDDSRITGKTKKIEIMTSHLRLQILEMVDDIVLNAEKNEAHTQPAQPTPAPEPVQAATISQIPSFAEAPAIQDQKQEKKPSAGKQEIPPEQDDSHPIVCKCIRISKSYRFGSIKFALQPISMALTLREITALVGENGSGKTTLLKMLAGEIMPTKGRILYPIVPLKSDQDYYSIKQNIAYIPQELPRWRGPVIDSLHFAASLHGLRGDQNLQEVDFIIHRLGLEKYRNASWGELSGGYKMRFSLAKALLKRPRFLVLDEPLANLDINTQAIFLKDLRDLSNSIANPMAIIITSQHLHEVENIADQILFLRDGQALYNGPMALFGEDRTENSFELSCSLSKSELEEIIRDTGFTKIEPEGDHFIVHVPRAIDEIGFIQLLMAHHVKVKFFRDISKSTRKLFSERI
jgi:ABC-2 type transport system ATP-binding protein